MRSPPTCVRHRRWSASSTRLVEREIGQLDPVTDVERRARGVLDQVARRGHADQHEREPLQLGVAARC